MPATSWTQYKKSNVISEFIPSNQIVGTEDASTEWNKDPEKSKSLFLHTRSYEVFKRPDILYLFGRRGTGKTALMNMLNNHINNEKSTDYYASAILDSESSFHELSLQIQGSPFAELPYGDLVYFLKKKWQWIIYVSAMAVYCNKIEKVNEDDQIIINYLETLGLGDLNEDYSRIIKISINNLQNNLEKINYAKEQLAAAISETLKIIKASNFITAKKTFEKILKNNKTLSLIMIDSIELYNVRDNVSRAIVDSLIRAAYNLFINKNNSRIILKIAFPSELWYNIRIFNPGKIEPLSIYILWSYRSLCCMLAKRLSKYYNKDADVNKYENFDNAKKLLYKHLPRKIISDQEIEFDTMAYIIRHTQKKPREVISIFNSILTRTRKKNNITKDQVKYCTHSQTSLFIEETLNIYEQIYDNATDIVRNVLNNMEFMFNISDLDKKIAEIKSIRSENSTSDVKRLLLDSGAIGIQLNLRNIPSFKEGKYLIEGMFEYQVKGTIEISNDTIMLIHPMFYNEIQAKVNLSYFIYPIPYETEEKDIIEEMGIHLA